MFVDDELSVLETFKSIFRNQFEVTIAQSAMEALGLLRMGLRYDVIVSDIMMPGMDGVEFLSNAKILAPLSTRIALTGHTDMDKLADVVNRGHVYKFLMKPCRADRLAAAILEAVNYAAHSRGTDADFSRNLLAALNFRNLETSMHVERVGRVSALLAQTLGWNEDGSTLLRMAAPLHDIGKIGIPDAVLLKPEQLSDEEYAIMKEHSRIGGEMLRNSSTPLLIMAREIALYHHERPDGTGYPHGILGEKIPLSARIVSVADVYDAIVTQRVYRNAMSHAEASALIKNGRDTAFDSMVVDAFISVMENLKTIYNPN
nr:HD domain-containing phosphohydrolase [Solidesulfovibrio aerotolerans]